MLPNDLQSTLHIQINNCHTFSIPAKTPFLKYLFSFLWNKSNSCSINLQAHKIYSIEAINSTEKALDNTFSTMML